MHLLISFKDAFTIIPILVGSLTPEKEALYGQLLAPYLIDPQNLFIISSDFCHWGSRFRYTYYDRSCGPIHSSIENLDKMVQLFIHFSTILFIEIRNTSQINFIYWWISFFYSGYGYHWNFKCFAIYRVFEKIRKHNMWTTSNWSITSGKYSISIEKIKIKNSLFLFIFLFIFIATGSAELSKKMQWSTIEFKVSQVCTEQSVLQHEWQFRKLCKCFLGTRVTNQSWIFISLIQKFAFIYTVQCVETKKKKEKNQYWI